MFGTKEKRGWGGETKLKFPEIFQMNISITQLRTSCGDGYGFISSEKFGIFHIAGSKLMTTSQMHALKLKLNYMKR